MNNSIYIHLMNQAIENIKIVLTEATENDLDALEDQIQALSDLTHILWAEYDDIQGGY